MGGAESAFRQEKAPDTMTHRNAPLPPQGRYRLTHDTLVGCGRRWVSFHWYYGVGGLVVGH